MVDDWVKVALPHVKRFEAFRANPYWDVKQWAIGYGSKCEKDHPAISEEMASNMLSDHLMRIAFKIAPAIKVKIDDNQGAALLSFAYNLGADALLKSTLLKKLNDGHITGAADQFLRWTKAGGKILPGLVKRRADERALFLS